VANYTEEQEARLKGASPVSFADAQAFADEFGKSVKSIIAKVLSLDLEYIPKAKPAKRVGGVTKAQLVEAIAAEVGADLSGLEKAPARALNALALALTSRDEVAES
jgi:hypothetical protein